MTPGTSQLAAKDPLLREVIDAASHALVPTASLIGSDMGRLVILRDDILCANERGKPLYLCPYCKHPVYIRAHMDQRGHHFVHRPNTQDDDQCPAAAARQLYTLDQLSAKQFRGKQEGALHRRLKSIVFHSLIADPAFSDIRVETTVKREDGAWRRPDVAATYHGTNGAPPQPVVFEIQLSTTAAQVMAERKVFYASLNTVLVWILDSYSLGWQSLMRQHTFYPNRRNALIVNQATLDASLERREFVLDCHWEEPNESGTSTPRRQDQVAFAQLTLDAKAQQAYYFDYDAAHSACEEQRQVATSQLRRSVIAAICDHHRRPRLSDDESHELDRRWHELQASLLTRENLSLPNRSDYHTDFWIQTAIALSLHGRCVVGTDHTSLIPFTHHVITQKQAHAWLLSDRDRVISSAGFPHDRGSKRKASNQAA